MEQILNFLQNVFLFNQWQETVKAIKYCIKLNNDNRLLKDQPHQYNGVIYLLYEHDKQLSQIMKNLTSSSFSTYQASLKNSPHAKQSIDYSYLRQNYISQKTFNEILNSSLQFIKNIFQQGNNLASDLNFCVILPEMIQVSNLGKINQSCKIFLNLFTSEQNNLIYNVSEGKIDIEKLYLSERLLHKINQVQHQKANNSVNNSQKFINYNLFDNQQSNKFYDLYLQSLGLIFLKLMSFSINKQIYEKFQMYNINQNYELVLNFKQIQEILKTLKKEKIYSNNILIKVQILVYNLTSQYKSIQEIQNLINSDKQCQKLILNNRKQVQVQNKFETFATKDYKTNHFNHKKSEINTPTKKYIKKDKSTSKSYQQTNKIINKNKPDKSISSNNKINGNTSPFKNNQKDKNTHVKNVSSFLSEPFENDNTSSEIEQNIKRKILYDHQGKLYPNIIEKKFRDGSKYIGQYNPIKKTKQGKGIYFYYEGDIYGGNWKNDQLNGLGFYYFANGDKYQGQVLNGQKQGFGVYEYVNGNKYKGFWKNDKKQGNGQYKYFNGDQYIGQFQQGQKQGKGVFIYKNQDIYQGQFHKNIKQGKGIFKNHQKGYQIQGQWHNDKLINQLKINFNKGNYFQGQVNQDGNISGKGKYVSNNNLIYQGQFKNNNYYGNCLINFYNGDIYKGEIKNNLFQGKGQYFFAKKKYKYVGNWLKGLQNGQGTLIYTNGTIINSKWNNGIYQKYGEILYTNNDKYKGQINQNGRNGKGIYYFSNNGKWIQGHFQDNKLIHTYSSS